MILAVMLLVGFAVMMIALIPKRPPDPLEQAKRDLKRVLRKEGIE